MIGKAILPLCLIAAPVAAIERHDTAGLELTVEVVEELVEVDGLGVRIVRASGQSVPELARRITARWQAEGSAIRALREGGWQLRSRWNRGRSEVLQWRDGPAPVELLHSQLQPDPRRAARQADPFSLPATCAWGRSIRADSGRKPYRQQSALCRASVQQVLPLVRVTLAASGWQIQAESAASLQLARGSSLARLSLIPGGNGTGSWLVWVDHEAGP